MFTDKRKRIMQDPTHIPLWLDNYDEIFSDFDPRPYINKALSDDFLLELKRASRDKAPGNIEVKLFFPKAKRNAKEEKLIRLRLRDHFKKHFNILEKEKRKIIKKGLGFSFFGVLLMAITTFLLFNYYEKNLFFTFLVVLFEPGGWFLFWEGLDMVLFKSKEEDKDFDFYKKMSTAEIDFFSY